MKYNLSILSIIACIILLMSSCKTDSTTDTSTTSPMAIAKAKHIETPSSGTAIAYINEIKKALAEKSGDKKSLLIEGQKLAEEYKMGPQSVNFLMPLIKEFSSDSGNGERIAKLSSVLYDLDRREASEILAQSYFSKYPEGKFIKTLTAKIGTKTTPAAETLSAMAKQVFENPDKYGINRKNAQHYVDACEAYALGFSDAEDAPLYLYRGAEMARTLRSFSKALSIYDWIADRYPNYDKTPTAVFLKGFMLENELNDKEKAREVYNGFLTKYPDNQLADDIKFLLQNIDKTDKEIMEMIEGKAKSK